MKASNILFDDTVRQKQSFWSTFFGKIYYESEKLTFKEKMYKFHYNMERTGYTTKGELDWAERMMKMDYSKYDEIHQEFKKDYVEFEMQRV